MQPPAATAPAPRSPCSWPVKSATMGLALLATSGMGGTTDSIEWLTRYGVIGFGGPGIAVWFFRHCRGEGNREKDAAKPGP